jgi:hypothetical protein
MTTKTAMCLNTSCYKRFDPSKRKFGGYCSQRCKDRQAVNFNHRKKASK